MSLFRHRRAPEHIAISTTPVAGAWKGTVRVAEHWPGDDERP
ncbi:MULTISPECIES: hypothetical protein [unclassified Mesorhizobium]|nr:MULTISPECIES: hypothetical protein [unclassified Mesorhizobium]